MRNACCGVYTTREEDGERAAKYDLYPEAYWRSRGRFPTSGITGDLDAFLASSKLDVAVISLPSTEKTRGSIGRDQFAKLKGCYPINLARGDIVKTDELVEALTPGVLLGAALDVTDPEPLPDRHPLWTGKECHRYTT